MTEFPTTSEFPTELPTHTVDASAQGEGWCLVRCVEREVGGEGCRARGAARWVLRAR